jgi:hypothetical protein
MNMYGFGRLLLVGPRTEDAVGSAQVKVQDEMQEEAAAIARTLAYLRRHIALPCTTDCHARACADLEEVAMRSRGWTHIGGLRAASVIQRTAASARRWPTR